MTATTVDRAAIVETLRKFIGQRSGIDYRNYVRGPGDKDGAAAFRADYRGILRDGRDARAMLAAVESSNMDADTLAAAMPCRDRLSFDPETGRLEYTAGQYFAVEYRAAACRALARAIVADWCSTGPLTRADVQRIAVRRLGRGIARRWFA